MTPNPPGTPRLVSGAPDAIAPTKGQHTREILSELGYSAAERDAFFAARIVG
jgi:crotonobetainyl-CoA:carnitine CoA-transferase CaiB-like acyl-CoA transferase